MRKKRKSNPFKMWSSWAGLSLGVILVFVIYKITYHGCTQGSFCFEDINRFGAIIFGIFAGIIGFLLGWAGNVLFRRKKK